MIVGNFGNCYGMEPVKLAEKLYPYKDGNSVCEKCETPTELKELSKYCGFCRECFSAELEDKIDYSHVEGNFDVD